MSMPLLGGTIASIPAFVPSQSAPTHLETPTTPLATSTQESYFDLPATSSTPVSRSIRHTIRGTNGSGSSAPLLGLSRASDGSRWATVGRHVLKIVQFPQSQGQLEGKCEIKLDLRSGAKLSKNYSLTCLKWGFESTADKIVTGCTNGSVILWNAAAGVAQRVEQIKSEHDRAINHITLAGPSGSFVITGGQDGFIRFWDIRKNNRTDDLSLYTASDAVRHLSLSPASSALSHLASVNESGALHKWDLRNASTSQDRIMAHVGGALCIDWKSNDLSSDKYEDDDGLLATGGLDGTVKIWSSRTTGLPPKPIRILNTTFGVQNVVWRPGHATQLAVSPHNVATSLLNRQNMNDLSYGKEARSSAGGGLTNEVELWDMRRESVPLAVLRPDDTTIADMAFDDPQGDLLVVVHRDSGCIARYDLQNELETPLLGIPTQQTAWNRNDDLAFVVNVDDDRDGTEEVQETQMIAVAEIDACEAEKEDFEYLTRNYIYERGTQTIHDACMHNAECAATVERYDLEATWLIIAACFVDVERAEAEGDTLEVDKPLPRTSVETYPIYRYTSPSGNGVSRKERSSPTQSASKYNTAFHNHIKSEGSTPSNGFANASHSRSASKGELSSSSVRSTSTSRQLGLVNRRLERHKPSTLSDVHSAPVTPSVEVDDEPGMGLSTTDTETSSDGGSKPRPKLKNLRGVSAATLRASRSRTRRGPGLAIDRVLAQTDGKLETLSELHWREDGSDGDGLVLPHAQTDKEQIRQYFEMMQRVTAQIGDALQDLANKGDTLTCVYAMQLLKDHIDLDPSLRARCTFALLQQFKSSNLHISAAATAKAADIGLINRKREDATTAYTACARCSKSILQPPFTYCQRCQASTALCAICHRNIRGRSIFCPTCGCSAHPRCLLPEARLESSRSRSPLSADEKECPSGCGHQSCPIAI